MKKIFAILLLCVSLNVVAQQSNLLQKVALYQPSCAQEFVPMKNGESYAVLSPDRKFIRQYSYKTGKEEAVLFDASKTRGGKLSRVEGFWFDDLGKQMMVYAESEKTIKEGRLARYYVFDIQRNRLHSLCDTAKQVGPVFSPNGRNIVFCMNNDLYLKKLDYDGINIRLTKNGITDSIYNGNGDWLYREMFGVESTVAWSSDNRFFAYVSLDDSELLEQPIVNYSLDTKPDAQPTVFSTYRYPKVGTTKNPKPALYIYDTYYKTSKKVELPKDELAYIPVLKWTSDKETVAAFVMNRNQNVVKMYHVNCKSLLFNALFEERVEKFYNPKWLKTITFLPDQKFTFISERDGHRHLYLYNANGISNKQLTKGEWDVTAFYGYDSIKNLFYYQAATESTVNREVFVINEKSESTRLTEKSGVNNAVFNSNFTYFIDSYSTINTPQKNIVYTSTGKEVREFEVTENSVLLQKELTKIASFDAWILKPKNFNATKKYPVIVLQNCTPENSYVKNEFSLGAEYVLADQGFVVVGVDVHGSDARGSQWRSSIYQRIGQIVAQDLNAVAHEVVKMPFADPKAVGIVGWGYGGYAALMAMSEEKSEFMAAVAIAPITDGKFFSSAFIERYMRRPQEFGGYDASSPIQKAKNMNGKLLLVHGTADEKVLIENTYAYADKLVEEGKLFQMQIYPNQNYDLKDVKPHLYQTVIQFFTQNLKVK